MEYEKENFWSTGPNHLATVNWNNMYHRRAVAASLVQGVKILEWDRQKGRRGGPQALAPPWWDFFHFQLATELFDEDDDSIFGAIYVLKHHASSYSYSAQYAPTYVIAFRGTLIKIESALEDIILDLKIILTKLHRSRRFEIAIRTVHKLIFQFKETQNVWLAGHSLGASIAMLVGKTMAKLNKFIESYLFNPLYPAVPVEQIKVPSLIKGVFRFTKSVVKAGASVVINGFHIDPENDPFFGLYDWTPYIFVNPSDYISAEYIGYFEHSRKMKKLGFGKIERVAARNSIVGTIFGALGSDSVSVHVLPSAYLIVNVTPVGSFRKDHGLHQWWRPEISWQFNLYQFRKKDLVSDDD